MNQEQQSIMNQVDVDLTGYNQPRCRRNPLFALDGTDITRK